MTQELINSKLDELNSLPGEESGKPYIPVSIVLQEASDLEHTCMQDRAKLVKACLNWTLVEDLRTRMGALQLAQSQWAYKYRNFQDCQNQWKIEAAQAYKLRDELLHHFRYILNNNPVEYAKLKRIDEGGSHADMIQDLSDLAELGKYHREELEKIGYDLSKLDEARTKSLSLSKLLSEVNGTYKETSPLLDLRNKAYVHLKEAVDEIRRVGQYVYWKNEKQLRGYISLYLRKRNKVRSKKEDQQETGNKE